jgi:hypothetical protein
MSKENKKFQKRKKRERLVKKKVLKKREEKRAEVRKERLEERQKKEEENKLEREIEEMEKLELWADEVYDKLPEKSREQIKTNIGILEALEEEYDREKSERQSLNDELEKQGHQTMDQKLNALQEKMVASGAETSDVEVIKNSSSEEED